MAIADINVTDMRDVDLSLLEIHMVRHGRLTLKAVPTISLEPTLDETKQLMCVEHAGLALDAFAPNREALITPG